MSKQVALRRLGLVGAVVVLGTLGGISASALGSGRAGAGQPTTGTTRTTTITIPTSTQDFACPTIRKSYACRYPPLTTPTQTNPS
jgi:hypothetical protein